MSDDSFTEPTGDSDEWVDVRMTDPERGEWDVDVVVADGRVEYVDLRVRPELTGAFIDCLVSDMDRERAGAVLASVAADNDIDLDPAA